jgi:hypothetical protein
MIVIYNISQLGKQGKLPAKYGLSVIESPLGKHKYSSDIHPASLPYGNFSLPYGKSQLNRQDVNYGVTPTATNTESNTASIPATNTVPGGRRRKSNKRKSHKRKSSNSKKSKSKTYKRKSNRSVKRR